MGCKRCASSCIDCIIPEAHYYSTHLFSKIYKTGLGYSSWSLASRNEAKFALLRKELESKIMHEEDDMDTFLASVKDINEQLIFCR